MAAGKRVKKKEGENLTPQAIEEVISLLEQGKPITKAEACKRLNIAYNTNRLTKIIEEYKHDKQNSQRLRAANRGKPPTPFELEYTIRGYLDGDPIQELADNMYRPVSFVKQVVADIGIPARGQGDYFKPDPLPEQCVTNSLEPGQVVWAARYNALAIVMKEELKVSETNFKVYQIYVIEPIDNDSLYSSLGYGGRYAVQPVYDLGSLEHLKQHGVDVYKPLRAYFPKMLAGR